MVAYLPSSAGLSAPLGDPACLVHPYTSRHQTVPDLVQVLSAFLRKNDGETEKRQRQSRSKSLSQLESTGFLRQTDVLNIVYFLEYTLWSCNKEEAWRAVEDTLESLGDFGQATWPQFNAHQGGSWGVSL